MQDRNLTHQGEQVVIGGAQYTRISGIEPAEDRNLTVEQISAALRAAALELAIREQQRIREQTLLVRARHWLARLLQAAARAIVPPRSDLRRRQP